MAHQSNQSIRRALLAGAAGFILSAAAEAAVAAEVAGAAHVEIPAEDLGQAVNALAQQTRREIIFNSDLARGVRSPALRGDLTAEEGLDRLLAGSDLTYRIGASGALIVEHAVRPQQGATAVAPRQPSTVSEVTVTGTNIHGLRNVASPKITLDRQEIVDSGFGNTDQLVRSLPQNTGSGQLGASPDGAIGSGRNGGNNIEGGTAVNLRGLGETSTLTLLDGGRVASSAYGGFVDVSMIPLLALERVEIVDDGASAIYGSDAVAGVANFILRKDLEGAETAARVGAATRGSLHEETASQALGHQWGQGGAVLTFEYNHRTALGASERSFTSTAPQPTNILNPYTKYSVVLTGHEKITDALDVFADALVARNSTKSVTTFGNGGNSTYDQFVDSNSTNVRAGLHYQAPRDWLFNLSTTYSNQDTSDGSNAYPGPVPLGTKIDFFNNTISSYDLSGSGDLFSLPGGIAKVAIGISDRDERAKHRNTAFGEALGFKRTVLAEYAELFLPIVSAANAAPGLQSLTFSAAVRHDHYSDFGDTTNPKLGANWGVTSDLDVRTTWGDAFRAPSAGELLLQQNGGPTILTFNFASPTGSGAVPIFLIGGAAHRLLPERARTWTVGFDYHPSFAPGLKLSLDYYNVVYRNRIELPPFNINALQLPGVFGSLVTPLSSDTAAAAYLAQFLAQSGARYINITGAGPTGVRYVFDDSLQNAAVSRQSGVDIQVQYATNFGDDYIEAKANVAFVNNIDTQFSPTSSPTNVINTYANPIGLRMRDELWWSRGEWQANGAVNFSKGYRDTSATPAGKVGAYTTVDVNLRYSPRLISGLTLQLSVQNLFDAKPPYVQGIGEPGIHYDVGNASPIGRFISFDIRKSW